jgi:hypothetical protein
MYFTPRFWMWGYPRVSRDRVRRGRRSQGCQSPRMRAQAIDVEIDPLELDIDQPIGKRLIEDDLRFADGWEPFGRDFFPRLALFQRQNLAIDRKDKKPVWISRQRNEPFSRHVFT